MNSTNYTELNTTEIPEPTCTCPTTIVPPLIPPAYGEHFELAGYLQIAFDLLLLLVQLLFIRGAHRLCGWRSDYSFTLLVYQAVSASQCYIFDILAVFSSILALNDVLNWQKSQLIFRIFGSFYGVPQFSIFFVSIWLSLHRCVYIFFPFKAAKIFTPRIAKVSFGIIIVVHLIAGIFWSTDWMGLRYYPSFFTFTIKAGLPFTDAMIVIGEETNLLIPVNMALYSLLVAYILVIKRVKISGNYEVRFTLQAFIVVLLEMGLFVFNYFSEANPDDPWLLILARTLTQQLYVAFPSITYLLVNREVRRGAFGLRDIDAVSRLTSTVH